MGVANGEGTVEESLELDQISAPAPKPSRPESRVAVPTLDEAHHPALHELPGGQIRAHPVQWPWTHRRSRTRPNVSTDQSSAAEAFASEAVGRDEVGSEWRDLDESGKVR